MARDNFGKDVSRAIAQRAAYICSNPECHKLTTGPHSDPKKGLISGVAAHISAASPGGPRYDPKLTTAQRKNIENAIWLCHVCSDIADKDPAKYPSSLLTQWKMDHEIFIQQQRTNPTTNTNAAIKASGIKRLKVNQNISLGYDALIDVTNSEDVDISDNIAAKR